jgi:hypothetical protein
MLNQWTLDPEVVRDVFREMEEDRTRPPRTVLEILVALAPLAPGFVEAVRASDPGRDWAR